MSDHVNGLDIEAPMDERQRPADGRRTLRPVVYQLDTRSDLRKAQLQSLWRDRFLRFLYAHGIRKAHFVLGTTIYVRVHEDGTLWLHTWQAVEGRPPCENCPTCIRQERVVIPLAAPVPNVPGCYIKQGWLERLTEVGR